MSQRDGAVVFASGRGPKWWAERNAQSPLPGLWPYGLEHLSEFAEVVPVELAPLGRVQRLVRSATGPRRRPATVEDPDVAWCWDERIAVDLLAGTTARRLLAGIIWATDQYVAGRDDRVMKLMAESLRQFDHLWCTCEPQVDVVRQWLGPDSPPVSFVPFGVDPTFYEFAEYPTTPLVASVGGDRDRDPETMLAAMGILAGPGSPAMVFQSREVDAQKAATGVEVVHSLPHVGVRALIARSTVVALATKPNWHASGLTVALESMSVGRPVVACDTPGMADYISPECGILVPPGDPEAMAAAVASLLENPERAAAMGEKGRQMVVAQFNTRRLCRDLADLAWPVDS